MHPALTNQLAKVRTRELACRAAPRRIQSRRRRLMLRTGR